MRGLLGSAILIYCLAPLWVWDDAAFGKVPQFTITDRTYTTDHKEQADYLLAKFFPNLPETI